MSEHLTLLQLVANAQLEHPCSFGHNWESVGGRACPVHPECKQSQTVYQCRTCGEFDYGEKGGPGYEDCQSYYEDLSSCRTY